MLWNACLLLDVPFSSLNLLALMFSTSWRSRLVSESSNRKKKEKLEQGRSRSFLLLFNQPVEVFFFSEINKLSPIPTQKCLKQFKVFYSFFDGRKSLREQSLWKKGSCSSCTKLHYGERKGKINNKHEELWETKEAWAVTLAAETYEFRWKPEKKFAIARNRSYRSITYSIYIYTWVKCKQ